MFESSQTDGVGCARNVETVTVVSTAAVDSDESSDVENDSDVENNSASVNCADMQR